MNITPHIPLGSGRLGPFSKQIRAAYNKAIKRIGNKVPISDVDVVIYDNAPGAIPEIGIGGYAPDAYTVFISLNPDFPNFEDTIAKELGRTLTHELHHNLRWKSPGYGETLLEALITEGLAEHFDVEVNKKSPQAWSTALSNDLLKKMLIKAKKEFNDKGYDHDSWFFGSDEKNIPKWTGYSLGFKLVSDFFEKNPRKKPSNTYSLKAEEFIG